MGRLRNFFVEEIKEEPEIDLDESYLEEPEEIVDVNVESVSQDTLIDDIYNNNDLSDLSRSIFKVEQLINSLPKEMPNETKKATVLTILSSFNLTVDEMIEDGNNRSSIIRSALKTIVEENEAVIANNNIIIEEKKKEIQELEKDNANRDLTIKKTDDKIEIELNRISDLLTFIGGVK